MAVLPPKIIRPRACLARRNTDGQFSPILDHWIPFADIRMKGAVMGSNMGFDGNSSVKPVQPFSRIRRFLACEDGPAVVEYAVLLLLIIIICLMAVTTIGTNANGTFNKVANSIPSTQQQTTGSPSSPAKAPPSRSAVP